MERGALDWKKQYCQSNYRPQGNLHTVSAIPIRLPMVFETQKTLNSQRIRQKEQSWRNHTEQKTLSVSKHQGNANQNHSELSAHSSHNSHHRKSLLPANAGEAAEKRGADTAGGNAIKVQPLQKLAWGFQKLKSRVSDPTTFHTWAYIQERWKLYAKKINAPQCSLKHCLQQPRLEATCVHRQTAG